MEYCTGGELFDRLATAPYSSRDAADVTANLASALKFLHDRGIVHRDLKPENLLLVDKNQSTWIKLADFGLAKIMSKNHMFTVCGTWAYCAPEVKSQPRDGYTKAVDVWSLGVRSVRARMSLQSPMNSRMLEIFFHCITPSYHKKITRKSSIHTRIYENLTRASRSNTGYYIHCSERIPSFRSGRRDSRSGLGIQDQVRYIRLR